jgi:hypothetical protein
MENKKTRKKNPLTWKKMSNQAGGFKGTGTAPLPDRSSNGNHISMVVRFVSALRQEIAQYFALV